MLKSETPPVYTSEVLHCPLANNAPLQLDLWINGVNNTYNVVYALDSNVHISCLLFVLTQESDDWDEHKQFPFLADMRIVQSTLRPQVCIREMSEQELSGTQHYVLIIEYIMHLYIETIRWYDTQYVSQYLISLLSPDKPADHVMNHRFYSFTINRKKKDFFSVQCFNNACYHNIQ